MNHQQTIKALAQRSGEQLETCEAVMNAYEKYAEKHLKKARRNNLDEMAATIAWETGLDSRICRNILTQFFDLLAERVARMSLVNRLGGK
ncbi:hypothetical protein [Enterococcus sp. AZ109]|uniref:hypothetical protein n=1 Tax=Enterococcus sp. AZ109 TaxID=2774634 RepID=UPI003F276679